MGLFPTQGCRSELARCRGPHLGEDGHAPLAKMQPVRGRHPGQLVHGMLHLYVPPQCLLLVKEICLPAQVLVVVLLCYLC